MTTEAEPTLAGDFPPATEEQWLALVDKVLKGAPLSKLESTTPGGLPVHPLYTRAGTPDGGDVSGVPGSAPFTRGAVAAARPEGAWGIRTLVTAPDPSDANKTILRELERGTTELTIRFDEAFRTGVTPHDAAFAELGGIGGVLLGTTKDLATVLDGVFLDLAPVHLEPGAQFTRAAEQLMAVWEAHELDPSSVRGGFGADPIGVLAATGRLPQGIEPALIELSSLAARASRTHPGVRTVSVDASPYVDAGASEVQELAVMLATGAAYLRALSTVGLDADAACAQIEVTLSADADVFTGIAKLRAARRLWSSMTAACGASDAAQAPVLHVRTAERMLTRRDPWVNLLRVTAASFAAGLGGAASVTALPFDAELGEPVELGRRMARNTQLLLQEESNLGRVIDPAGGSWYVESLTDEIATAAWALFAELEAAGGLPAVLLDGSLAARIAEVRDDRLRRVATRREPITGVSEFPDIAEAPLNRTEPDLRTLRSRATSQAGPAPARPAGDTPTECEPLPKVRWAQQFERLRDGSDSYMAATGGRPKVFLVNVGPVAVHTARATFAKNFFEAGGIQAVTSERGATVGFDDPADAVADVFADGAHLVCICSSDALYAERAEAMASALAAAGLTNIYLAGNPGDRRDAELAAGVTEFVHVGVDVLDVLQRAHDHIGTPTGAVTR
ncbi:MAG: methylmalonyl-CoA mutase subunit beta [Actinomycetota bacterium]|nr:methylmalonyl-CoA mutase subunit beta [Actinomycetota bacterium]